MCQVPALERNAGDSPGVAEGLCPALAPPAEPRGSSTHPRGDGGRAGGGSLSPTLSRREESTCQVWSDSPALPASSQLNLLHRKQGSFVFVLSYPELKSNVFIRKNFKYIRLRIYVHARETGSPHSFSTSLPYAPRRNTIHTQL